MIDGMRHQVIDGLDWSKGLESIAIAAALAGLAIFGANRALRSRLRRAA
jgi:hypothetical protein